VWCHDVDELARRNYLCFLPKLWEMPLVTGHVLYGVALAAIYL
jgi:hypothetical protein